MKHGWLTAGEGFEIGGPGDCTMLMFSPLAVASAAAAAIGDCVVGAAAVDSAVADRALTSASDILGLIVSCACFCVSESGWAACGNCSDCCDCITADEVLDCDAADSDVVS